MLPVLWLVQSGYIFSKAIPQLVLGVSSRRLTAQLLHPHQGETGGRGEGFSVELQSKSRSANQQWTFTTDGFIANDVSESLSIYYLSNFLILSILFTVLLDKWNRLL